jgi:DNA-binding MarR family transcriptional regulator
VACLAVLALLAVAGLGYRVGSGPALPTGPVTAFVLDLPREPIQVGIHAAPMTGGRPLTVDFQAVVQGGSGRYVEYAWSFGDGDRGLGTQLNYTYLTTGEFTVVLVVTDSDGTNGTGSVGIRVTAVPSTVPVSAAPLTLALGILVGSVAGAVAWRVETWGPQYAIPTDPRASRPEGTLALGGGLGRSPPPSEVTSSSGRDRAARPPRPEAVRTSYRLLAHLLRQPRLVPGQVVPSGRTQADLVDELDASQSTISELLARLTAAEVVYSELRHVADRSRRVRVYGLTPRGERLARELLPEASRGNDLVGLLPGTAARGTDPDGGRPER